MHNLLNQLTEALRARGFWENTQPSVEALNSTQPFCVDYLTFSQWLQWVYLPKMLEALQRQQLPTVSHLLPMAEEAWKGCSDTAELLRIIAQLDHWINGKKNDE